MMFQILNECERKIILSLMSVFLFVYVLLVGAGIFSLFESIFPE